MNDLFSGKTREEVAIERIIAHKPQDGSDYYGATSFGKDSVVIMELGRLSGLKISWNYALTTVDPPELIKFGRKNFPFVQFNKPKIPLLKLLETKGFPTSSNRWCCSEYKENYGTDRTIILGVRWAESKKRAARKVFEPCFKDSRKFYVNPIIDWSDVDVWNYIHSHKLPYCTLYDEGFKRLGCIMCPKAALKNRQREAERWPGMARAWKKSFLKLYENKHERESFKRWKSGEEMFAWWMSEQASEGDPDQAVMFE